MGANCRTEEEKKTATAETNAKNVEKHKTLKSTGSLNSKCPVFVAHSTVETTLRYGTETRAYASG